MIRQNLHTHSTYADGKNPLEETVLEAIDKKFTILGFSEHAYVDCDDCCMTLESTESYIQEVRALQKKYANQIQIYLGLEQDIERRDTHPEVYDYMIGSGHYLIQNGDVHSVDNTKEDVQWMLENWYGNDFLRYADAYYAQLKQMADWDEVDIIAHLIS